MRKLYTVFFLLISNVVFAQGIFDNGLWFKVNDPRISSQSIAQSNWILSIINDGKDINVFVQSVRNGHKYVYFGKGQIENTSIKFRDELGGKYIFVIEKTEIYGVERPVVILSYSDTPDGEIGYFIQWQGVQK
jgi:hypothetical protein